MGDYLQAVDRIRSFVQGSDQTRQDFLVELASEYAAACEAVNRRLAECGRLLQKGLRSEAIHRAEAEPNLLETMAALDFPERGAWDEITGIYKLAVAPPLAIDMAEHLNAAYAEEDPLQDILNKHRKAALARAPLPVRMGILRQIAGLDPNNLIWVEDLRILEGVRVRQIQQEAAGAVTRRDLGTLAGLRQELEAGSWTERPPASLVQGVEKASTQLRAMLAREEMKAVGEELNNAFAAFDVAAGRVARRRWNDLVGAAMLPADSPLVEQAAPTLQWLDDQDRRDRADRDYEAAVAELERALDDGLPLDEIERLGNAVLRMERGMPSTLEKRYLTRVESLEIAAARRRRTIAIVAGVAVVLIAGGTFAVVRQQNANREIAEAVAALGKALEGGDLEGAIRVHDGLKANRPELLGAAPMLEVVARLEQAQARERVRAEQWRAALNEAADAPPAAEAPASLQQARSLTRLDPEKEEVERVARRRELDWRAEVARREKALAPRVEAVGAKVHEVEGLAARGAESEGALQTALEEADAALRALGPELEGVGEEMRGLGRAYGSRLNAIHEQIALRDRRIRLEGALTQAIAKTGASGERIAAAMDSYIRDLPESVATRGMRKALEERPAWESVLAWDALVAPWSTPYSRVDPATARDRAAACRKFLDEHPRFPDRASVAAFAEFYDAIGLRDKSDGVRDQLRRLLSDRLIDPLWMIRYGEPGISTLTRYYLVSDPGRKVASIRYLVSFDGRERSTTLIATKVSYIGVSPQSKIAQKFKEKLDRAETLIGWEEPAAEFARDVLADPDFDPIFKLAVVSKVLEVAAQASLPLRQGAKPLLQAIENADVDVNVAWMDPDDEGALRLRPRAERVVAGLPRADELFKGIEAARLAVEAGISGRPRPVGWLSQGSGWVVQAGEDLPTSGRLCVVVPDGDAASRWVQVGDLARAPGEVATSDAEALVPGRPVFVLAGGQPPAR